jgi:hypothetical protein
MPGVFSGRNASRKAEKIHWRKHRKFFKILFTRLKTPDNYPASHPQRTLIPKSGQFVVKITQKWNAQVFSPKLFQFVTTLCRYTFSRKRSFTLSVC